MRTGILGGTFNPPHLGHLHAAELAKDALHLDKVLFIPTNIPPHKAMPAHTATAADRCEMVRLMIRGLPWAQLDRLEIERGGASYTVDTLHELRERGEDDLYLIVGTDMLLSFDGIWRAADEIVRLCTLAVWRARGRGRGRAGAQGAGASRQNGRPDRTDPGQKPGPFHRPSCGTAANCAATPRPRSQIISSAITCTVIHKFKSI